MVMGSEWCSYIIGCIRGIGQSDTGKVTRWQQFERYCIKVTPILEAISRNGLGIDPAAQKGFFDTLTAERDDILTAIQTAIPASVLREKTWKRAPKVMTDDTFLRTDAEGKKQWYRRIPFSPRSWQQVQELAAALGAKLPRKQGSDDPDDGSTDDKALKRLQKKWPVFGQIREYRKRDKLITAYQWPLDGHNRVHPTFAFHPSTWRKSCRNPNIQTIPKRSDLAKQFRKMIVPRPGNVLIEGDSAAIEAVMVGWLAGSQRYIRLARAGVHGWITSALHGEPLSLDISDDALIAGCRLAKEKWPDDYEKCKRVVHLSNYCGTPRRIAEEYPDEFPTESSAGRLQSFYFSTEAGQDIKAWQKQTIEIAHANKGLENHFGLRHRFYSLYSYDSRRQCYVLGDDAKRAVAFVPQSDASFVQSDILLRLVERDSRFLDWLVGIVHDSIILDVPLSESGYAAVTLYEEMVRPLPQLDGLYIGAEVKRGYNLGEMEVLSCSAQAVANVQPGQVSGICATEGHNGG